MSDKPFRLRLLDIAQTCVGKITEDPGRPNRSATIDHIHRALGYGDNYGQRWCAMGVSWCGMRVIDPSLHDPFYCRKRLSFLYFRASGKCEAIRQDALARGTYRLKAETPLPGWLVFFQFDSDSAADHIEIVERAGPGKGQITTIGFNTSKTGTGSQANGDGCWRRIRSLKKVMGYAAI